MRLIILTYFIGISCVFGQGMSSFQLDNYSGVHGVYLNPGSIADSHWKGHLNIGFGSLQTSPDRLGSETIVLSGKSFKFQDTKYGVSQNELRGPGLMVQLRNNHAFAITTRYRATQLLSGNYELVTWLKGDVTQKPTGANLFNLRNNAFSEYAFSYAAPIYNKGKHFIKAGVTYKLLHGWQTLTVNARGNLADGTGKTISYTSDSFIASHSDLSYTSDLNITNALTGKAPGKGSGFDIGVIYEFRPQAESSQYLLNGKTRSDPEKTRYLVKAGISIMDIGKIKYGKIQNYAGPVAGNLVQEDYSELTNSEELRLQLFQNLGLEGQESVGSSTVDLPQVIAIQADVSLGNGWYAGGVFTAPKNASKTNLSTSSQLAIGPRYEANDFGFGITGQYYSTFGKAAVGANLRLGVFSLGTDNLLGFFKKNGLNPQAYAGFFIPMGKWRKEKDRDNDNVSDRKDTCPDLAGLWGFKGCPDTDEDGIEDRFDKCPEDADPAATNGCPDSDGDGIFDKSDACPNNAGLPKFNGCPDKDNDGISDSEDECPDVAGLPELSGCPDTDLDGIKDYQDKCPDTAGLKETEGCPLLDLSKTNLVDSAEKDLVVSLSKALRSSPVLSDSIKSSVQNWLSSHPNGKLSIIFSGVDQELVLRIAGYYKDELTALFGDRIVASVLVVAGQAPGISVEVNR